MNDRGLYNYFYGRAHTPIEKEQFDAVYEHELQMYVVPPARGNVRLDELYKWSFGRLKVLGYVEEVVKKSLNFRLRLPTLLGLLEENGLTEFATLYNIHADCDPGIRKRLVIFDSMAHFFLKSAFAFDISKISWFIKQEMHLFSWRLCSLPLTSIYRFMELNDITYPKISMEERKEISQGLELCHTPEEVEKMDFYKVHFTQVKGLVANGRVYLRRGTAYVPESKVYHLITHNFLKKLESSAAQGQVAHGTISSEDRFKNLMKLLLNFAERYFKWRNNFNTYNLVTYNELDLLSKRSYPLCMRMVHETLRRTHHVTNGGRMQYTLFLKAIGLPLDDAIQLWRTEFCRVMPREQFEKEYKYYICHLYGTVGRMANYLPFECSKIMNTTLLPRDCHGCPYKCMSTSLLETALREYGLCKLNVDNIIALTRQNKYLQACKMYYETTHGVVLNAPFEHPNDYFKSSLKHFAGEEAESNAEDERTDEGLEQ